MASQNNSINNEPNSYIEELKKCVGQEVVVADMNGKEFKGICKAVSFTHLNIVLMDNEEKIIIKNISHIRRKRNYPNLTKNEAQITKVKTKK